MALAPPLGNQVRPYRDYLTPALHRRFNKASRYTLLLCYAIACWMGSWDKPLWLWFPIGPTGIRTLLLFIPALTIYVLRVAQWHVGRRQTQTRAETFRKYFLRKSTILTMVFYAFSAWIYGETYIWSRGPSDKLGLTDYGRAHERVKLNERPLYLRYLFFLLAIAQSCIHLWKDYDKIDVPAMKPKEGRDDASATPIKLSPNPRQVLLGQLVGMATKSGILALVVAVGGFVFYFVGPRYVIWDYYYSFSKYFVSLSKTSKPAGLAPFLPLCFQFVIQGAFLTLIWEFVNKAFDLYIAQEPLKNDKPITSDSKDPNGTLLNGLKSKKEAVKNIAFWELALITDAFPDRRTTIYGEIDRKKAPTFLQVTDICLGEIKLLIQRIGVGLDPTFQPAPLPSTQPSAPTNLVPRIALPLKDEKGITAPAPKAVTKWEQFEAAATGIAKSHSTPANSQQAYGREVIKKGTQKAQEGAQQAESMMTLYYDKLVSSPLGTPFAQSIQRTANLIVLGAPYSHMSLICNAVTALSNLTVFSLTQDSLGRFHEGVPEIIRVFTAAIAKIDEFMDKIEIHWSDRATLRKPEGERRKVKEVEEVRECLREGLEKILGSFNEYLGGIGLSKLEILEAKKAIVTAKKVEAIGSTASAGAIGGNKAPEMVQTRNAGPR